MLCLSNFHEILFKIYWQHRGNGIWARHMLPVCYLPFIYAQLTQLQVRHAALANSPQTRAYPAFIIITSPEIYRRKKGKRKKERKKKMEFVDMMMMNVDECPGLKRTSAALVNVLICLWQLLSALEKLNVKCQAHIKHQLFMPSDKRVCVESKSFCIAYIWGPPFLPVHLRLYV